MSKTKESLLSVTTTWVVLLTALVCLVSCGKKEETPPTAEVIPESVPTVDDTIAAMLRGHPNSRRVCVDGLRERSFFIEYSPRPKEGEEANWPFHGWLFIEKVDFYKTSNNTWFITDQSEKKYIQVYPDITGLNCKAH